MAALPVKHWLNRSLKFFASLKLAVVTIISLGTLVAIGTFVEAKYNDSMAAKKTVYDTVWMYIVMGMLAVNLIGVMVDRWPWKQRHTPFVLAHIGILILMAGSIMTMQYGIDGSVRVPIGGSSQYVVIPEKTEVLAYSSFDGDRYTKLAENEVDFFTNRPSAQKPVTIMGYDAKIQITDYKPYVIPSRKVLPAREANGMHGAGLRFQIQNPNVNVVEWMVQRRPRDLVTHDFGPAALHLGAAPEKGQSRNEIYFTPEGKDHLKYVVFQKDQEKPLNTGVVKEGSVFNPGWKMPMDVRVLRYLPEAEEDWELQDREASTPLTTSAVKVEFNGQNHWMLLNDSVKLFTQDAVYIVTYGNRRLDLGFPIKLNKFEVDRYQGTNRAMAYKSRVEISNLGEREISMNEPLKHHGFTIYQSSFEEGPNGSGPTASIFSVNQDPGRWVKYLGSLIMVIGIVMLFYFKQKVKKGNPT
jgi:hypothetical protein